MWAGVFLKSTQAHGRASRGRCRVCKIKKVVKRRGVGVLVLRLEIYLQGTTEQQVDLGREGRGLFFWVGS